MMFLKLAPSAACTALERRGRKRRRRGRKGGRADFQNNGPANMWYSESTQKQVSGNHVHSSARRGGKACAHALPPTPPPHSFSWHLEWRVHFFILTDRLFGCNWSIGASLIFPSCAFMPLWAMSRCRRAQKGGPFRSIILPFRNHPSTT